MARFIPVALALAFVAPLGGRVRDAYEQLAPAQSEQLFFNQNQPAAALYHFRSLQSGHCIIASADFPRVDFFRTGKCDEDRTNPIQTWTTIATIPTPTGRYTLRVINTSPDGRLRLCATVARNVLVGPARIDLVECDVATGGTDWSAAGGADQRFQFRRVSAGVYEILTPTFECWDVRNQSRETGAEIIRWNCNGQANQRFELTYVSHLPDVEARFVTLSGWRKGPEGMRRVTAVNGVNLPGHDYTSQPTANDGGLACGTACADDARCRAYTWVRPGVQGAEAMCWLKDNVPPAVVDKDTASMIIR